MPTKRPSGSLVCTSTWARSSGLQAAYSLPWNPSTPSGDTHSTRTWRAPRRRYQAFRSAAEVSSAYGTCTWVWPAPVLSCPQLEVGEWIAAPVCRAMYTSTTGGHAGSAGSTRAPASSLQVKRASCPAMSTAMRCRRPQASEAPGRARPGPHRARPATRSRVEPPSSSSRTSAPAPTVCSASPSARRRSRARRPSGPHGRRLALVTSSVPMRAPPPPPPPPPPAPPPPPGSSPGRVAHRPPSAAAVRPPVEWALAAAPHGPATEGVKSGGGAGARSVRRRRQDSMAPDGGRSAGEQRSRR